MKIVYERDKVLQIKPGTCLRCGMDERYHIGPKGREGRIPCIRSKPYKLRDGVDVKLGMQVWHVHPWDAGEKDAKIITGMVRFIRDGSLTLWKFPEDRDPTRVMDLSHEGCYTAKFGCFSSLENLEKFREKCRKR